MLITVTSAKGSPGVTTAALALAASGARGGDPALIVEVDHSGGDLECWSGPFGEPGLLGLATDSWVDEPTERVWHHAVPALDAEPTLAAIVGPTSFRPMAAALAAAERHLINTLPRINATVVADVGRWSAHDYPVGLLAASSVVVIVLRPTLDGVEHAREVIPELKLSNRRVVALAIGTKPYGPAELAPALGVRVVGALPWDRRGLSSLLGLTGPRFWPGSPLSKAAVHALSGIEMTPGLDLIDV